MRRGGFTVDLTHHAMHSLGSRILGFTQELFNDTSELDTSPEMAAVMAREMAVTYPYITELATAVSHEGGLDDCDDDAEFEFGLDLVLDGLERMRDAPAAPRTPHQTEQVNGVASEPNGGLDPLVARAIANLRDAAAHANGDASHPDTIDPNLLQQMRATLIEVFDAVFEHPRQRAARRKALDRRSRRR